MPGRHGPLAGFNVAVGLHVIAGLDLEGAWNS